MTEADARVVSVRRSRAEKEAEFSEVDALLRAVEAMRGSPERPFETRVELGEGLSVKAVVDPPHERVHAHLGLGVFVELPLETASRVCESRLELIRRKLRLLHEEEASLAEAASQ